MLPTPSTSHVDYNRIYEPAEDSFLLLDTLSSTSETSFLQGRFPVEHPAPLVLEVGTGSGVVLAFVTAHAKQIFGRSDVITLGTDLNPFACVASRNTVELAVNETNKHLRSGIYLDSVNCNLATVIAPGTVDVLIFNPPYVPSEDVPSISGCGASQDASHLLSLSTDGGLDGMETTNVLLADLDRILSPYGVVYILLCAQNKPDEVVARINAWPDAMHDGRLIHWRIAKVSSSGKKAGWERLCVIRVWRETVPS